MMPIYMSWCSCKAEASLHQEAQQVLAAKHAWMTGNRIQCQSTLQIAWLCVMGDTPAVAHLPLCCSITSLAEMKEPGYHHAHVLCECNTQAIHNQDMPSFFAAHM